MSSENTRFNFVTDQNEVVGSDAYLGKAIRKCIGIKRTITTAYGST
ncbi:hypothetical protein NKH19_32380 [Mesorhizobium sp. M1338]